MAKKEVLSDYKRNKQRKDLIQLAIDLDANIQHHEDNLRDVLQDIKELAPTRKELKDGLEDLMNCYL